MSTEDDEDSDGSGGGGIPTDVILSYLTFARRAVRSRLWLAIPTFVALASITIAAAILWPRTYECGSRLTAEANQVLATRGDSVGDALRGAGDAILRRDNLEAIAKQVDLVRVSRERRPFILRLKDRIMSAVRGTPSDKDLLEGLVLTLESKLSVEVKDQSLTIIVEWGDPQTATELVEAAQENFIESRHVAEISTYTEYISILEEHASTIRTEIETLAAQIQKQRQDKFAQIQQKAKGTTHEDQPAEAAPVRRATSVRPRPEDDEDLPRLKTELESKQRTVKELEDYRSHRLLELQAKLSELQGTYTAAHPAILEVQQNIASLSKPSPQVQTLQQQVSDIQLEIRRRGSSDTQAANPFAGGGRAGGATPTEGQNGNNGPGLISSEIMSLMEEGGNNLDPAMAAQLGYAVEKYSTLRSQIISTRIDLDTAQAAFRHRYNVVLPAEVPTKPIKPKVPGIVGLGLAGALLISLLLPIALQLRSGRIISKWQVQQIALPVLAELHLPPSSEE